MILGLPAIEQSKIKIDINQGIAKILDQEVKLNVNHYKKHSEIRTLKKVSIPAGKEIQLKIKVHDIVRSVHTGICTSTSRDEYFCPQQHTHGRFYCGLNGFFFGLALPASIASSVVSKFGKVAQRIELRDVKSMMSLTV